MTCHVREASRTALVAMLGGQADDLHARMVMNELERTGWDVLTVPRTIDAEELARLHRRARPDSTIFTIARDSSLEDATRLVGAVDGTRPILIGARGTCEVQLETIRVAVDARVAASVGSIAQLALPTPARRAA